MALTETTASSSLSEISVQNSRDQLIVYKHVQRQPRGTSTRHVTKETRSSNCRSFAKYIFFIIFVILFWIITFVIHQSIKKMKES